MKRTIFLLSILLFGLVLTSDAGSQRRKAQRQTQPNVGQQQMRRNLERLNGTWEMAATYSESGATLSNNRLTFGASNTTVTGKQVIEQPDPDTITFNFNEYFFTLKRDAPSKRYILRVKKGNEPVIDDVVLVYRDKEGFIKAGPSKGGQTGFSPKILFEETGGHTWLIKSDFKITFTKPKEGETKNL